MPVLKRTIIKKWLLFSVTKLGGRMAMRRRKPNFQNLDYTVFFLREKNSTLWSLRRESSAVRLACSKLFANLSHCSGWTIRFSVRFSQTSDFNPFVRLRHTIGHRVWSHTVYAHDHLIVLRLSIWELIQVWTRCSNTIEAHRLIGSFVFWRENKKLLQAFSHLITTCQKLLASFGPSCKSFRYVLSHCLSELKVFHLKHF